MNLHGIFIAADNPEFLEERADPKAKTLDLESIDIAALLHDRRERERNFDTAPFDPSGKYFRIYPGGYTVWSGFPGAGKTSLMRQLACHLISAGKRVMVASLEERAPDVFYEHTCVAAGTDVPSQSQLEWAAFHWQDKLRIWSCADDAAYAEILAAARVVANQDPSTTFHLIIDSLMTLDVSEKDIDAQKQFVLALKRSLKWRPNMHIHLVAHPKKPQHADQKPDQNDVAGSASISRLADSIVLMRKPANEAIKEMAKINAMSAWICKQRYNKGRQGELTGWFDRHHMQFVEADNWGQPLPGIVRYLPPQAYCASVTAAEPSVTDIARGPWNSDSPFEGRA